MSWAVVLGASSGTGAAVAAEAGRACRLDVFGVHRGNWPEEAVAVDDALRRSGRRCHFWVADASRPAAAAEGASRLLELAGRASVKLFVHAIASAAVGTLATGDEPLHPRQIERTFDRMAHSFVYWARELVRRDLLGLGAVLLGLGNPMPHALIRHTALITATKAALEQYVRHLAYELGPLGHRGNLLEFGLVETPAVRRTFTPEALRHLEDTVCTGVYGRRIATMEEVARVVAWLASDDASFFNGATLDLTGGEGRMWFDVAVYGRKR